MAYDTWLYLGYREPLWPLKGHDTAHRGVVLYLSRGRRWGRLGLAENLPHVHSPAGFNWGYGGSGPAELARHLIVHATGKRGYLERPDLYQDFKREFVATWGDQWALEGDTIRQWVAEHDHGDPFAVPGDEGERSGARPVLELVRGRP